MRTEEWLKWALISMGALYALNYLVLGFLVGPFDYDHLSAYYQIAWEFWKSPGGLPHFNPYFCGGRTLGGDPQIPIFSPLTLLVPLLGPTWLIKLEMLAQLGLGAYGLWRLMDFFRATREGKFWGLLVFVTGGGITSRFLVGHVTLGFYFLFPLFLFLSYRLCEPAPTQHKFKLFGLYTLLFIYSGLYKPNFMLYAVPVLLVEHVARAVLKKNAKIFFYFVAAVALCALTNAVSYLPAWKYFSDFPRPDDLPTKFIPIYAFLAGLVFPLKAIPEVLYGEVFLQRHEYSNFVGPVALFFAWFGFKRSKSEFRAEIFSLVIFMIVSIWIGLGSPETGFSLFFPFSWLRSIWPGFDSVRVPVRFWFSAYVVLILFSSLGFRLPKTRWQFIVLILIGILPLWIPAAINLTKPTVLAKRTQWTKAEIRSREPRWVEGDPHSMLPYIRNGVGILNCADNIEVFEAKGLKARPHIPKITSSGDFITARWKDWSRIHLEASSDVSFTILLNFNHSDYWTFSNSTGVITSKPYELLKLEASTGHLKGDLVFRQPFVKLSLLISVITWVVLIFGFGLAAFKMKRE